MTWPAHPTDVTGTLVIEDELVLEGSANLVTMAGRPFGCYLDDSTPRLAWWVEEALADKSLGIVFVSVPMTRPLWKQERVFNLLEWYPVNAGFDPGSMPKCEGYILQRAYPGYLHEREPHADLKPPTEKQFKVLLAEARAHHPIHILEF